MYLKIVATRVLRECHPQHSKVVHRASFWIYLADPKRMPMIRKFEDVEELFGHRIMEDYSIIKYSARKLDAARHDPINWATR